MLLSDEILFYTLALSPKDLDSFIEKASVKLSHINIKLRKRLISCSIELIQNNFIHNQSELTLLIIDKGNYYTIEITQMIDTLQYKNLKEHLDTINKMSQDELKEKHKNNLISNTLNSTGNGLIFCRLKSENMINLSFVNDMNKIALKFNKYENHN